MVRLARERDAEAEQAADARDEAGVDALLFQHRPLLDVQLEVGADLVDATRIREALEFESAGGHRLAYAAAVPVLQVEVADEGAAPEHPGLEAAPFLVVERDDPQRAAKRSLRALQRPDDVERREHTEPAVGPASPGNGVEVGSDEDRGSFPLVPAAEHVPRRVDLRLE